MENEMRYAEPGMTAPADGNSGGEASKYGAGLGANLELLEELRPELVNALRELVRQCRQEGVTARRHEIRRIRQARLFWQGLQYAWWNPNDMNWHLPFEQKFNDDRALEEMPRYQFVTNFYQGFGLSFVAVLSQDIPSVRWMHRRMGDDEIQRVFVRDLALRHLPNIYRALNTIAEQQGIQLEETPMVNYVDLRNGGRHR
jgi:hypothetical protein